MHRNLKPAPQHMRQCTDEGHRLCRNRRDRRTCCPQLKITRQQKIQYNIDHAGNRNENDRRLRVPQSAIDTADRVIPDDKRQTGTADKDILPCIRHRFGRRHHHRNHPICPQQHDRRQKYRDRDKQKGQVADSPCDARLVVFANPPSNQHRSAHRNPLYQCRHRHHQLGTDRNRRYRC